MCTRAVQLILDVGSAQYRKKTWPEANSFLIHILLNIVEMLLSRNAIARC